MMHQSRRLPDTEPTITDPAQLIAPTDSAVVRYQYTTTGGELNLE